jgi:hypothetical protein
MRTRTILTALLALWILLVPSLRAQPRTYNTYLPRIVYHSLIPNRLGIDLRQEAPDTALTPLREVGARWARAGDVDWSRVEAQQGVIDWSAAAEFDANIRRIRGIGMEPTGIIQRTPLWATAVAGRVCGQPAPTAINAYVQFAETMARRYANGPLKLDVWQIGNEVDFAPDQIVDWLGSGCWGTGIPPYYGGDYYGAALKQVSAAIQRGNPDAVIIAGGLAHPWPNDEQTLGFVRGMLAAGAGSSFDALSFSGYGSIGVNDKFLLKSTHLRAVLAEYGLAWKPLIVSELSAPCFSPESCGPGFTEYQSDYAARIYAELIAADMQMGVWFSLQMPDDDAMKHDLLDGPESIRRPAYYALRNSLALLRDAQPGSPPAIQPDSVSIQTVQLRTPRGSIYVIWNPSRLGSTAFLLIPAGAHLICTDHLELPTPQTYDCTNQVSDGVLLAQTNSTRYVEVIGP